jgi:hypothetical protein
MRLKIHHAHIGGEIEIRRVLHVRIEVHVAPTDVKGFGEQFWHLKPNANKPQSKKLWSLTELEQRTEMNYKISCFRENSIL